jgi:hypothetical protein
LIEGLVVALDALSPLLDAFVAIEEKEEEKPEEIAPRKITPIFPTSPIFSAKLDDDRIASFLKDFDL